MVKKFLADGGFDKNGVPRAALYDSGGRKLTARDIEIVKIDFIIDEEDEFLSAIYNFSKYEKIDIYVKNEVKNGIRLRFAMTFEESGPVYPINFYDWNTDEWLYHMRDTNDFILSYRPNSLYSLMTHPNSFWLKNTLGRTQLRVSPFNFSETGNVEIYVVGRL